MKDNLKNKKGTFRGQGTFRGPGAVVENEMQNS